MQQYNDLKYKVVHPRMINAEVKINVLERARQGPDLNPIEMLWK